MSNLSWVENSDIIPTPVNWYFYLIIYTGQSYQRHICEYFFGYRAVSSRANIIGSDN